MIVSLQEDKPAVIARMRYLRPSADFRKHFQYCNLCYVVASTLPERLYSISFTRYVEDNVLAPLGMRDTYFDGVDKRMMRQRSHAFIRNNQDFAACIRDEEQGRASSEECLGERTDIGTSTGSTDVIAGQGGLVMSARDMVCQYIFHSCAIRSIEMTEKSSRTGSLDKDTPS